MLEETRENTAVDLNVAAKPAMQRGAETPARATRPFDDIAQSTWLIFVGVWVVFFLVLVAIFGGLGDVLFTLGVIFAFGAVFFGVPYALLRMTRTKAKASEPKKYLDTLNGRMSQGEVLAQMVMVPVLVTLGMVAIGFIALQAR